MKSPKQPFRPALLETMHAAREELAAQTFDPVTVKSLLTKTAGKGEAVCVIPTPLDLRETAAGRQIVGWCAAEGLSWEWSRRAPREAYAEPAFDLVVSWQAKALNQDGPTTVSSLSTALTAGARSVGHDGPTVAAEG